MKSLIELFKDTIYFWKLWILDSIKDFTQETSRYAVLREMVETYKCPVRPSVQHWWTFEEILDGTGTEKVIYCTKCGIRDKDLVVDRPS